MDLFGKIVDLFYKSVDFFYKIEDIFNKISYGFLNKIVDLLFREGGSSAPREPPWLRACIINTHQLF